VLPGTELLNLDTCTVSAWVNPDDIRGRWGIIAKRTDNSGSPLVVAITNGAIELNAATEDGRWPYNTQSRPCVKAHEWQQVAVVLDQEQDQRPHPAKLWLGMGNLWDPEETCLAEQCLPADARSTRPWRPAAPRQAGPSEKPGP